MRGSVVDVRFEQRLLPIYSVLRAGDEGRIVIEVLAQHDARPVRGIALTPTQGLARGMTVDEASALRAERDGQTFYFCGDHCRQVSVNACSRHRGARSLGIDERTIKT